MSNLMSMDNTKPASSIPLIEPVTSEDSINTLFEKEKEIYKKTSVDNFNNYKIGEILIANKIEDTTTYTNILRYVIDILFEQLRSKITSDRNITMEDKQKAFLKLTVIDAVFTATIKMVELLDINLNKNDFIFSLKGFVNKAIITIHKKS